MNEAVFKSILHKVRGSEGASREDSPRQISEPKSPTAETLAASILAENEPNEVDSILRVWESLGKNLDRTKILKQLEDLKTWRTRRSGVKGATIKL